jgi:hypothetical protein
MYLACFCIAPTELPYTRAYRLIVFLFHSLPLNGFFKMNTTGPGRSPRLLCFLLRCSTARWPAKPACRQYGPRRRLTSCLRCCSGSARRSMLLSALSGRPLMLSLKQRTARRLPLLQPLAQQRLSAVMSLQAALTADPAMANNI